MLRVLFALVAVAVAAVVAVASLPGSRAQPEAGPAGAVALSGPWTVRVGHGPAGALERTVSLPYVVNATGFTGRRGLVSFQGSIAWYRKRFSVPSDGPYVLRFESVQHKATVWIDGHLKRRH